MKLKQFEYKTTSFAIVCSPGPQRGIAAFDPISYPNIDAYLDEYGREGWAVVGVASAQDGFLTVVLKREK